MAASSRARPAKPEPATEREIANLERDLATVAKRKARTKAADDNAAAERDRIIRDAIAAGMQRTRIVELTGLSPQRVDQIRRGSRI